MFLLHAIILGVLGVSLVNFFVNLWFFRSIPPVKGAPVSHGKVSILVPARDEERSIGECVSSLIAQDYPDFEVIVLNDSSFDRTAEIAGELLIGPNRLLNGAPLPEGWTGKNWACHQLSEAAAGEWLLFTDADTVHSPGALSAAIAMAVKERVDLFSAWPRQKTLTLGEKLVVPMLYVISFCWFPIAGIRFLQKHPGFAARLPKSWLRSTGGANGQFVLFRRAAYASLGGHAAVRDHIVEDVALGRAMALRIPEGMRQMNCDASRLIDCRMYRSFREVCDGFTKNVRAAFEDSLLSWYMVGGMQFTVFFLPFLLGVHHRAVQVEIGIIYLMRLAIVLRVRSSWIGGIFHPVGQFLAMAIGLRSWIVTAGPGVEWKGRRYQPNLASRM